MLPRVDDRRIEQSCGEAKSPMLAAHHEARDRPDAGVIQRFACAACDLARAPNPDLLAGCSVATAREGVFGIIEPCRGGRFDRDRWHVPTVRRPGVIRHIDAFASTHASG